MSKLAKALTAAAGNAAGESLYVEDVFSTYLYEGTGATQSITNGIDLDGEGGLVWVKNRDGVAREHFLVDSERGVGGYLATNSTQQEVTYNTSYGITSLDSTGFSLGLAYGGNVNSSGVNYSSWTFRKAEKFFDVVTYTGNGVAGRTVSHNLGSVPAVIIVKRLSGTTDWNVYHSSLGATKRIKLNTTDAEQTLSNVWNNTSPTDSVFTLGTSSNVNNNGDSYVAYLFASDAGGFGDDGSESIIKCGSYTGDGTSDHSIEVGFEPQWLLIKNTSLARDWVLSDSMRGLNLSQDYILRPNATTIEQNWAVAEVTSTGFRLTDGDDKWNTSGHNFIYIAIRRPMKTPESGTEVFDINTRSGNGTTGTVISTDVRPDANLIKVRSNNEHWMFSPRLLSSNSGTSSNGLPLNETTGLSATRMYSFTNNSYTLYNSGEVNGSGETYVDYIFSRASGFFDTVAYTGDGSSSLTVPHNLTVVPELILTTIYSTNGRRYVYHKDLGNTSGLWWNDNVSERTGESYWASTTPTSSNFYVGASSTTNVSSGKYISFMFATLDGVSKVGSYTGTGSNIDVDCGFSAGARFILIKRTDASGDWYVWDSERGIVAGNDPYLLLNVQNAEVTSTDYIDPLASGFTVTSSAPAALNASGGTYIFLAIA